MDIYKHIIAKGSGTVPKIVDSLILVLAFPKQLEDEEYGELYSFLLQGFPYEDMVIPPRSMVNVASYLRNEEQIFVAVFDLTVNLRTI